MNLSPSALVLLLFAGQAWLSMAGLCARPYRITPPAMIRSLCVASLLCLARPESNWNKAKRKIPAGILFFQP